LDFELQIVNFSRGDNLKNLGLSSFFWFAVFLLSCGANSQHKTQFSSGRQALFTGNYESALSYFQMVAQQDPNYVYGSEPVQGVWTYVGIAQYLTGNLAQAQQTLERVVSQPQRADVARLYLGLTLARLNERQKGLQDIEAGMKGIHNFLDYMNQAFRYGIGQFYDPRQAIRSAIEKAQAMIASENINWPQLLSDGERIGIEIEQESDRAQKQQLMDQRDQM
jgi:tetratricopeptide (TPR) repeat protein